MAEHDIDNGSVEAGVAAAAAAPPPAEENGVLAPLSFGLIKPHLFIEAPRAVEAVHFYKRAFGAEEVKKSFYPKRKVDQEQLLIMHAHLKFGSAELIVSDQTEEEGHNAKSPAALHGTTAIFHVETNDVDAAFAQALEAGAKVEEEVSDQPWGQRYGKIVDPFGFVWSLATPLEEIVYAEEAAPDEDEEEPADEDEQAVEYEDQDAVADDLQQ